MQEQTAHILQYGDPEPLIYCGDTAIAVDLLYKNKIIEFYGDYWHANPKKYKANDKIKNSTVQHIWDKDSARIHLLNEAGYKVFIIWESDTQHNTTKIIEQCLNFLQQ